MVDRLWYASYGSNLLRERFMAYIRGGRVPGSPSHQIGCRDSTPPARDHGVMILHQMLFSGASSAWENRGVAFIRPQRDSAAKTLGRMYLITRDQFEDLVVQENGHPHLGVHLGLDLEMTIRDGRSRLERGLYSTVLHLGQEGGYPIFTFTGSWSQSGPTLSSPGARYLQIMARGLKETYGMNHGGIVDYLSDVEGLRHAMSRVELEQAIAEVVPAYPSSFT